MARRSRVNELSSLKSSARNAAGLTPNISLTPREARPPADVYSYVADEAYVA